MNEFEKLVALIKEVEESGDAVKFYAKGNSTAGTRIRKAMQDIKDQAQKVRKEVSDLKTEK